MCLMYVGIFMSESTERSLSYVYSKPVSYYMDRSVPSIDRLALTRDVTQAMQGNKKDSIIVIDYKKRPLGIITISDILSKVGDEEIAETTFAKDIMSSPLLSIRERQTVQSALIMMRDRNIKHLPVLNRRGALVGMVSERTLSEAIRDATLKDARALNPPIKAILGNLGFVLQFAGVLMLVPAMLATVLNDPLTATGIYISTVFLLVTGFFLNSYGEKSSLNMQQASILVFLSMFILILFGTLPYLYVAPHGAESALERFASSFFSSAAGFTTGGISLFEQPEDLPQSFTFYRSFTQLVGGMSFIYLVMTAFYPEDKMLSMRGFLAGKVLHLRELFGTNYRDIPPLHYCDGHATVRARREECDRPLLLGDEHGGHRRVSAQLYHTPRDAVVPTCGAARRDDPRGPPVYAPLCPCEAELRHAQDWRRGDRVSPGPGRLHTALLCAERA